MKKLLYLIPLITSLCFAAEPQFHLRELETPKDTQAINENFRNAAGEILVNETNIDTNVTDIDTNASDIDDLEAIVSILRGYLNGLILENHTDTDHDILINVGMARSADNDTTINLTSSLIKQIDATWASGTNAGGMASGVSLTADTWYHLFVIYNPTTEVTDVVFDTSITNANAPSGYTEYRRIGSVLTDGSSNIRQFKQTGNYFYWKSPILNYSAAPSTSAVLVTMSVPVGIKSLALYSLSVKNTINQNTNNYHYVSDPDTNDLVPSNTNITESWSYSTGWADYGGTGQTMTDTSSQLRIRSLAAVTGTVNLATQGWQDFLSSSIAGGGGGGGGGGITNLNGLSSASQVFATGTAGTDFAISSVTSTHTFNLPTASTTNRGALSSADWDTFTAKENALTFSTGLTRTVDTITTNDSQIDHDSLTNTHNLTTDIDHDALTNFVSGEHFLQSAITTVGTIGTGVWQGTPIADAYIASTFLKNIVEDTTPQLGGTLDAQEFAIDNVGDITHDDATPSDWTLKNEDQDKDTIVKVNDGGVDTESFRIIGTTGVTDFDIFPTTPSSAPSADYQVANKKYVDDSAGGGAVILQGYIDGLVIENDTDTAHDIKINTGQAASADNSVYITLASALVKRIDANWSAGTGNGGFPSGLSIAADTWYHFFVIVDNDTGTEDAGFDTDLTASNLLSDASAYDDYRRVGSVLTDGSSNIIQFIQIGDYFTIDPIVNSSTLPASLTAVAVTVPLGVKCGAIMAYIVVGTGTDFYLSTGDTSWEWLQGVSVTVAAEKGSVKVLTNTSSQIKHRYVGAAPSSYTLETRGWQDFRGKQ